MSYRFKCYKSLKYSFSPKLEHKILIVWMLFGSSSLYIILKLLGEEGKKNFFLFLQKEANWSSQRTCGY